MINRAAILLKYKPAAVKWANDADPHDDNPGLTIESANNDRTIYLVPDQVAEDPDSIRVWIELNLEALFENELEGWYTDESLWPKGRTIELFNEWFEVECYSVVIDTFDGPILDDDFEDE